MIKINLKYRMGRRLSWRKRASPRQSRHMWRTSRNCRVSSRNSRFRCRKSREF